METGKSVESEMFVVMTCLRKLEINDSECLNFSGPSFFFPSARKFQVSYMPLTQFLVNITWYQWRNRKWDEWLTVLKQNPGIWGWEVAQHLLACFYACIHTNKKTCSLSLGLAVNGMNALKALSTLTGSWTEVNKYWLLPTLFYVTACTSFCVLSEWLENSTLLWILSL